MHFVSASYDQTFGRMKRLQHLLKRIEFDAMDSDDGKKIVKEYSVYAVVIVTIAYVYCREKIFQKLLELYRKYDAEKVKLLEEYRNVFCEIIEFQSVVNVLKEGNQMNRKKTFVFADKRTDELLAKEIAVKYDREDVVIFASKCLANISALKCVAVWEGILPELISVEQDKLYSNYEQVIAYGNQAEEFIKLFQETDVPVTWYVEDGYRSIVTYSKNIIFMESVHLNK